MDSNYTLKQAEDFRLNLINAIILFASTPEYLDSLSGPAFDPLFELDTDLDFAYNEVLFEVIFDYKLIDSKYKEALLVFKTKADSIPDEKWTWELLSDSPEWNEIRKDANELLDIIGVKTRKYNDDNIIIISSTGEVLKARK